MKTAKPSRPARASDARAFAAGWVMAALAAVALALGLLPATALAAGGQDTASGQLAAAQGAAGTAAAGAKGGKCGDNLTWALSGGVLTISGTGAMKNYFYYDDPAPWHGDRANITSVVIGDGVTSIGSYAFYGCALESVTIPGSVQYINEYAFARCDPLAGVTIMEGVREIRTFAFKGSALKSITIPGSVQRVFSGAFQECKSLESVTIMDGVEHIGASAFNDCGSIREITVPASVGEIGDDAFLGAFSNLPDVYYGGTEEQLVSHCHPGFPHDDGFTQLAWSGRNHYECHAVRVHASPASGGTASGGRTYEKGSTAAVSAAPAAGYRFAGWTEGGKAVGDKPAYSFPVDGDRVLTANFVRVHTITWRQDDGALIGWTTVDHGKVPSHADPAKPATSQRTYRFRGWSPKVVAATRDATYTAAYDAFPAARAANPMTAKGKKPSVSGAKLAKRARTIKRSKAIAVRKAAGRVTYKLKKVSKAKFRKYFKVNRKKGSIKVRKGLGKGAYRLRVAVTAAGNDRYEPLTRTVTVKVRVR